MFARLGALSILSEVLTTPDGAGITRSVIGAEISFSFADAAGAATDALAGVVTVDREIDRSA